MVGRTGRNRGEAWWARVLDLVLPAECAGCGVTGQGAVASGLCAPCAAALSGEPRPARPARPPAALPPVMALAAYRDPVPNIVVAQKEYRRLDLARPLGRHLARAVRAALGDAPPKGRAADGSAPGVPPSADPVWLVPVPSTRAAARRRGHDPVAAMARAAAADLRASGRPAHVLSALRHNRRVADQAGLSRAQRLANLDGALAVKPAVAALLAQRPAILLDDVVTSGATLAAAATAVRRTGGHPAAAAVLAATRLVPAALPAPGR